jgi:DNA-binding XRE family transcriptional regulator
MARKTRQELETIRELAQCDYPASKRTQKHTQKRAKLPTTAIATKLRRARKAQGLTWYALAQAAGIPNPNTVRDIEEGTRDARLSNIEAIADALGLTLELTETAP